MNARLLGLLGLALVAACAGTPAEEQQTADGALSGSVAAGTVVTTTASLRIRRSASSADDQNILGILPPGTKVKITSATATAGFYAVEVQDSALVQKLQTAKGWCYGEYLLGKTSDPAASSGTNGGNGQDDLTGVPDVQPPRTMTVPFVSKNCRPLKDDNGDYMKPTIDDFVINAGGKVAFAAMEINSDALPYGTMLHIPEIDAKPAIKNAGRSVQFKVVKTDSASSDPLTVTLCTTASGFLPAAGSQLTLQIDN